MHPALRNLSLILVALPMAACFPSDEPASTAGSTTAGASGAATGNALIFEGIGTADALSPTEVALSWPAATEQDGSGARTMIYHIYRSFDSAENAREGTPFYTSNPGETSYVDSDLPRPYAIDTEDLDGDGDITEEFPIERTIYYRIEAENAHGQLASVSNVASARTPAPYDLDNPIDYATDIEPMWYGVNPKTGLDMLDINGRSCLDCHNASSTNTSSFETWEDVMVGNGDKERQEPDSFITAFDGPATWYKMQRGMYFSKSHHIAYLGTNTLDLMEYAVIDWANNGALEIPDTERPVFRFDDIRNMGKFKSSWVDYNTILVEWFQAEDLESLPYGCQENYAANQLNYQVFVGATSNEIDWDNPAATLMGTSSQTMSVEIDWEGGATAVIVVRAFDAAGRAAYTPADPGAMGTEADRSNLDVNEREFFLTR